MKLTPGLVLLGVAFGGSAVRADEPKPSPTPSPADSQLIGTVVGGGGASGAQISIELAPERRPDTTPRDVSVPGSWNPDRESKDAGSLKGVRVLSTERGQARVVLADGERVLRPGDVVGSDVVKSVESGRILLVRGDTAQQPDGEALVVVSVDAQGRTRVRVYLTKNPTTAPVSN